MKGGGFGRWARGLSPRGAGVWGTLCLGLAVCAGPSQARPAEGAEIRYELSIPRASEHWLHVALEFRGGDCETVAVAMPAWNALYQIRDFAQFLRGLRATDGAGASLAVTAIDKQTWRIARRGAPLVRIEYDLAAESLSPFQSHVSEEHVFLNAASALLYVIGRVEEPVALDLRVPRDWRVATELSPLGDGRSWRASSYVHLADSPVEVGHFQRYEGTGGGVPFAVVVHGGEGRYDPQALVDLLARILDVEVGLFGGAPFSHFTFLYHFTDGPSGGGMEHRAWTAINLAADRVAEDIEAVAATSAHELFHAWNVKFIRPRAFVPETFADEVCTRALWFAEGVTSYYGDLALLRAGITTEEEFYSSLAEAIAHLEETPARHHQSPEDSSWRTWFDRYSWYRRPENSVSYYTTGQLLGFLLDLTLRDATDNRRSLDDVLRFMNWWFGMRGVGYDDSEDIQWAASAVAQRDLSDFFDRYVRGTEHLPWEDLLPRAGLALVRWTERTADPGLVAVQNFDEPVTVAEVSEGGPAAKAGVRPGDRILSLDGAPLGRDYAAALRRVAPGEEMVLGLQRGERLMEVRLIPGERAWGRCRIEFRDDVTPRARAIREGIRTGQPR